MGYPRAGGKGIIVGKELPMSPTTLASEPSSARRPAVPATPRTCPMVVVTDVDGTLRDPQTRSLAPADLALSTLSTHGVPVVLTSAGAAGDLIALQDALDLQHPFICEGCTEMHIPTGIFPARTCHGRAHARGRSSTWGRAKPRRARFDC